MNVFFCCNFCPPAADVQGQLGSTQNKGLIPCVLLVLKEMLPTYHKWRYNTYGVQERIGEPSLQPWCWHCILSKAKKKKKSQI